jgi:site-specific DNA recombinase
MEAAIYARVSTERQDLQQTIESQIAILTAWVRQQGYHLAEEHHYCDRGYSGARLNRPALDRLRDDAQAGAFGLVAILTPDRLARKYAYQALLLDELRRSGCQVVFVQHPISDDPNDQLLLQIQAAVAEYERAVLGERFRRGKLHKARTGQYVANVAPYGYRYVPKQDGCPGHLVIDEAEAAIVRMLYRWLVDEQLTVRQVLKRLQAGPWRPRSGKPYWAASVVHHILSDPVYTGTAYVNRYDYVPAVKPRRPESPRSGSPTCKRRRPPEDWIAIPVPAIIDPATADQAQAQRARNAVLSYRHNQKHDYLLRCLLTCGNCSLAMHGVTYPATGQQPARSYYRCGGRDPVLRGQGRICPRHPIRCADIDRAVWDHVVALLNDPARLLAQFQHQAQLATEGDSQERAEAQQLAARLERLGREERRLLDGYQAGIITLAELAERRQQVARHRQAVEEQREQQARLRRERAQAQAVLTELTAFCERIQQRLAAATVADQQAMLQLLIERIIVHEDTLEIRHVIPLHSAPGEPARPAPPIPGLRSDGMRPTEGSLLGREPAIRRPAVRPHYPCKLGSQQRFDDSPAPAAVNPKHGQLGGHHGPQPGSPLLLAPAGLVHVDYVRLLDRGPGFLHDER